MELTEAIRTIRWWHGMSRSDFGNRIGVLEGKVYEWEFKQSKPSFDELCKISDCFHVSLKFLMIPDYDDGINRAYSAEMMSTKDDYMSGRR